MKKTLRGFGLGFLILLAIIILVGLPGQKSTLVDKINILNDEKKEWPNPLNDTVLVDNKALYTNQEYSRVDKIYVTILPPKSQQAVTFDQLNDYNSSDDIDSTFDPVVEVFFEADNPGNNLAVDLEANAIMELRGQSARTAPQKSYKIRLFDNTGEWFNYNIINLNKHFFSTLKVENKLAFDYFSMLPDFVSLRTRFVRLYVKDLSSNKSNSDFEDYGFFTFIEQPNKKFLEVHNLDKNGHFYKIEFFEFFRYKDVIKLKEDTTYDEKEFERILGIAGNDNHQKLIDMLEAVNDYNQDINEVVDKYFDRDNLLTWLAVNILFDNYDTSSRNFFLYSPLNSDQWFFVPWDYDKMSIEYVRRGKWQQGLTNYWGMVLFKRFFKDYDNVESLGRKIEELTKIIYAENTRRLMDSYYKIVTENIYRLPDVSYQIPRGEYEQMYRSVSSYIDNNKKYFYESLENPMPFFLGEPEVKNRTCLFNWEASYDLQDDELVYEFVIGLDPEFNSIVAAYRNLKITSLTVSDLKPGRYFWKVVAYDSKGNWQNSFNYYRDSDNDIFFGIKQLVVK